MAEAISYVVVSLLMIMFLLKIAADLSFAYGLLFMRERRPVSWFWLVEIVPLTLSVIIAWAAGLEGWFSPAFLGIAGSCLIVGTFVHLFLVVGSYGVAMHLRNRRKSANE